MPAGQPRHRGPTTDHFNGRRFRNRPPVFRPGLIDLLRWQFSREGGPWKPVPASEPGPPPPGRVQGPDLRVTFVNHSTLLLQTSGLNIITDPIWSELPRGRVFSSIGQPNWLAGYLLITATITASLAAAAPSRSTRIMATVSTLLQGIVLTATLSRSGYMGVLAALAVTALLTLRLGSRRPPPLDPDRRSA